MLGATNVSWAAAPGGGRAFFSADLSQAHPSPSGKTVVVASTHGRRAIGGSGLYVNLHAFMAQGGKFDEQGLGKFVAWECENMQLKLEGTVLTCVCDLTKGVRPIQEGQVNILSSTKGNHLIGDSQVLLSCTIYAAAAAAPNLPRLAVYAGDTTALKRKATDGALVRCSKRRRKIGSFTPVFFPGPDSSAAVAAAVAGAKASVDVVAGALGDAGVVEALVARQQAGVKVRILVDKDHYAGSGLESVVSLGVTLDVRQSKGPRPLNLCFCIVDDGASVVVGSGQFQREKAGWMDAVVCDRSDVTAKFVDEFERLWEGVPEDTVAPAESGARLNDVAVLLFPDRDGSNQDQLFEVLGAATASLDICMNAVSSPAAVAALVDAQKRGLRVRLVTDTVRFLYETSEAMKELRKAGIEVKFDGTRATMDHRFVVVDSRTVITGSFSFAEKPTGAEPLEAALIVHNSPALAQAYARQFDSLWRVFRKL